MITLRRVAAGVYETADGAHRIIRVVWEGCGPKGGQAVLWEHAMPYADGWAIEGPLGPTLRVARGELARKVAA